jgi:hypothetical protein
MNFSNTSKIYEANESLLKSEGGACRSTVVHHRPYRNFNAAINDLLTTCKYLNIEERPDLLKYIRSHRKMQRAYISIPLPLKQASKGLMFPLNTPNISEAIHEKYSRLEEARNTLFGEEQHPYEDLISSSWKPSSVGSGIIRIVTQKKYTAPCASEIERRLGQYENLLLCEIQVLSQREASTAEEVADLQIVLGNIDYLASHPFEDYRSISSARAKSLDLICLAPHARHDDFSEYYLALKNAGALEKSFEPYVVGEDASTVEESPPEDLVFPDLKNHPSFLREHGDDHSHQIEIVYEGPEGCEISSGRHIIKIQGTRSPTDFQITSATRVGVDELELNDFIALQEGGLRGEELSTKFSSHESYQKVRATATDWKRRLNDRGGYGEKWTLNHVKIKGGEIMKDLNEGHLSRWKNVQTSAGPQDSKVFFRLLQILGYSDDEIKRTIVAKAKLDNYHRQFGKTATKKATKMFRGQVVRGDILKQHLPLTVTVDDSPLEFTVFRIIDVYPDLES